MKKQINLLSEKKSRQLILEDTVKRIRLVSFGLLIIYCVAAAGIFLFWMNLNREMNNIRQQIDQKKVEITRLSKQENMLVALKQRLDFLQKVLSAKKVSISDITQKILSTEAPGLVITELNINTQGMIVYKGESANSLIISDLIQSLKNQKDDFKQASITNLNRSLEGTYLFEISMVLK